MKTLTDHLRVKGLPRNVGFSQTTHFRVVPHISIKQRLPAVGVVQLLHLFFLLSFEAQHLFRQKEVDFQGLWTESVSQKTRTDMFTVFIFVIFNRFSELASLMLNGRRAGSRQSLSPAGFKAL